MGAVGESGGIRARAENSGVEVVGQGLVEVEGTDAKRWSGTGSGSAGPSRALDTDILIYDANTMQRHLAVMLLPRQLGAWIVAGFAALALLLASVGLYGLVGYAVVRRAREVGIRLSLGADPGRVAWMLAGDGMRLVAIGGAIGLLLSVGVAQLLSRLLYGVPALDLLTFLGVPLVLGTVAFVASWVPARRASRVDPTETLRRE